MASTADAVTWTVAPRAPATRVYENLLALSGDAGPGNLLLSGTNGIEALSPSAGSSAWTEIARVPAVWNQI